MLYIFELRLHYADVLQILPKLFDVGFKLVILNLLVAFDLWSNFRIVVEFDIVSLVANSIGRINTALAPLFQFTFHLHFGIFS